MIHKDKTFHQKLVDLYANRELPEELENELVEAAGKDPQLAHDMATLRQTVLRLQNQPAPPYDEDAEYRVFMKLQAWGDVDLLEQPSVPPTRQYRLPMEG